MSDEPITATPASSGQVMDVTAPQAPTSVAPEPSPKLENTPFSNVNEVQNAPSQADELMEVETEEVPENSAEPATSSPTKSPIDEPKSETTPNAEQPTIATPPLGVPLSNKTAHQHRAPIGAIVAAVFVALLLIGLSVYAWQKSSHIKPAYNSIGQKNTSATVKPADVAQMSSNLDSSLKKIDDSKDFSSNDLSNPTLGL